MKRNKDGSWQYSPSDLRKYLDSEFVTWMDRFNIEYPGLVVPDEDDESMELFQSKGIEHELRFLQRLIDDGLDVCQIPESYDRFQLTGEALKQGRQVIYQAALSDGEFAGYADFLFRVPGESALGDFHYEPWDTKLARKAKPYFLVQLSCYADLLDCVQKIRPDRFVVLLGDGQEKSFRTEDYFYYYRQLRESFLEQQKNWTRNNCPDFSGREDFGRWKSHAEKLILEQDHLCQVANIRSTQIKKLRGAGIDTMTQLAQTTLPSVPKMQAATFQTLRRQARLQVESKGLDKPKFEVILPQTPGQGLCALPKPSPMDVFFDMEGFPLADGGLEYLFGACTRDEAVSQFHDWWAHDSAQEKKAFEEFVDWVYARWRKDPFMHIYHYASYERSALRRLMGKYGTREKEVDDLLRAEVLVDLYAVVRHAVAIGEPSYSIKYVEHLYMGKRKGDVATASDSVVQYQKWCDEPDGDHWSNSKKLNDIREYNREDCESTVALAKWLLDLQQQHGFEFRPIGADETSKESDGSRQRQEAALLAAELLESVPAEAAFKSDDQRVRELLAHLLEFHWREAKPVFWAMFDRHEMTEQELFEEPACLSGLVRTDMPPRTPKKGKLLHYDYRFDPDQDTKIDEDDNCYYAHDLSEKISVDCINVDAGTITLKRNQKLDGPPQRLSLIKNEYIDPSAISKSLYSTVFAYSRGVALPEALSDFLYRRRPNIKGNESGPLLSPDEDLAEATAELISKMQKTSLCIQGPPGSGKTYTAAVAIVKLMQQGKRVGVSSNSHKAVANLLDAVAVCAMERGVRFRGVKLQSKKKDFHVESPVIEAMSSSEMFDAGYGGFQLIGGTAWTFSSAKAVRMVDYLFIDEAGQVSLANLVGMAPSARNLVLIGDQMQLSQPVQGTHPGESGQSILDYLLQGKQVIPDDFGVFLGTSWRMHPDVCEFVSGAIYEDRLHSHSSTSKRVLKVSSKNPDSLLKSSGIVYIPVNHEGNTQDSEEEVEAIVKLVAELKDCTIIDESGGRKATLDDILIVAPYNMQVRRLRSALPGVSVGSVDKFQGQEAPVVIVSMCSSTGDASPRGLEFIFSKNRLNVAISRAKSLAIVVGSPQLARTHCGRVEQMELVNLFCRILHTGRKKAAPTS